PEVRRGRALGARRPDPSAGRAAVTGSLVARCPAVRLPRRVVLFRREPTELRPLRRFRLLSWCGWGRRPAHHLGEFRQAVLAVAVLVAVLLRRDEKLALIGEMRR